LPPTSVSFSAAPSALTLAGRPSSLNENRFTPRGARSCRVGIGSAQSGVGPSTNRLTSSLGLSVATSTVTVDSPSRLTLRIVRGFGSPIRAGFGTISSAAASVLSSALATLAKASSMLASAGMHSFAHTAKLTVARSVIGLSALVAAIRSGSTTCSL